MQSNKQNDSILLDSELASKDTKIVGLYDPEKYGRDVRTDEEHSHRVQENGASTRGR